MPCCVMLRQALACSIAAGLCEDLAVPWPVGDVAGLHQTWADQPAQDSHESRLPDSMLLWRAGEELLGEAVAVLQCSGEDRGAALKVARHRRQC